MITAMPTFTVNCQGNTAIVSASGNFGEFAVEKLHTAITDGLNRFDQVPDVKNVVIDLEHTEYFGSSALGLFIRLWHRVSSRGGKMALCNLTDFEEEILRVTELDNFWTVCDSRDEALKAVI